MKHKLDGRFQYKASVDNSVSTGFQDNGFENSLATSTDSIVQWMFSNKLILVSNIGIYSYWEDFNSVCFRINIKSAIQTGLRYIERMRFKETYQMQDIFNTINYILPSNYFS